MAEALFNARAPAGWRAGSAGTDPRGTVRAEAVAVMHEIGLDISQHVPRALAEVLGPDVEVVVGLCAEEACPVVPGVRTLHWPLPNPAGQPAAVYRAIRDDLVQRITRLIEELPRGSAGTG
jgi:protein-tyrosine-phosphatase